MACGRCVTGLQSVLILSLWALLSGAGEGADRIVLRDLDIITGVTVEQFDVDGVRLSDGRVIGWDRIEQGRVAEAKQAAFDRMLEELGSHLYRIRQRLSVNDYRGLLADAEAVHDHYRGRRGETAYMVCQALMWSRLAVGRREAALPAYLWCLECLRQAAADQRELSLPGARRLQVDLSSGLSPELPPVWFDDEAARERLGEVGRTISTMSEPRPPATRVYYATLALAAGESDKARQALAGLEALPQWKSIIDARMQLDGGDTTLAIDALTRQLDQLDDPLKPIALYWLGQARLSESDTDTRRAGVLDLLRIPALFGERHPELAAAGLYTAMRTLEESGDMTGSIAIRRELLDQYGQTWHAERVRPEDKKTQR
ncbi:MAG: tetratricopeptide repeat protein [Planctomycetota bacterium]